MTLSHEINFDGLAGPTHNYAGLSDGNIASMAHGGDVSNPREAALQGIAKMRLLVSLGVQQGVLPPHERPHVEALRRFGFTGPDGEVLAEAARRAPEILAACSSASSMWAANAATVAPSADAVDGRVHVTPANLGSTLHRSLEPRFTARMFRALFPDDERFFHHDPLPGGAAMGDEGAANHTRLCASHGAPGLHVFVHGRDGRRTPARFPARQSRQASCAVARLNRLPPERTLHLLQAPEAIDTGVFHNDVVCVGNENILMLHERAFADPAAIGEIRAAFADLAGDELRVVSVPESRLSLEQAVSSYLFNSQLVTLPPPGGMVLIAPIECREIAAVSRILDDLVADATVPVSAVHVVDTRQSMRNGGGPACLRLRVVLTEAEIGSVARGVLVDDPLLARLEQWVRRHYRDRLAPQDLADPSLLDESRRALDELTGILELGALYDFQR